MKYHTSVTGKLKLNAIGKTKERSGDNFDNE